MKESLVLEEYGLPRSSRAYAASFVSCFGWYRRTVDHSPFVSEAVDLAAGGLTFAVLYPQSSDAPEDPISALAPSSPAIGRICRQAGYLYESIEKWNGVYNSLYFQGRIRAQLRRHVPVLFLDGRRGREWHILIGMEADAKAICFLAPGGETAWLSDWYERMEGFLLLRKEEPAHQEGRDIVALLRRALKQRREPLPGFAVGEEAYAAWQRDLSSSGDERAVRRSLAMRDRLVEARRGALTLVRLLAVQYPDAQRALRPADETLARLLEALESMDGFCAWHIGAIARQDAHAIRELERILLCDILHTNESD